MNAQAIEQPSTDTSGAKSEAKPRAGSLKRVVAKTESFAEQEKLLSPAGAAGGAGGAGGPSGPSGGAASGGAPGGGARPGAGPGAGPGASAALTKPLTPIAKAVKPLTPLSPRPLAAAAKKPLPAAGMQGAKVGDAPKAAVLPVSKPGDAMEQEAHKVADAVQSGDTCADCGGAMKPTGEGESECATCGARGAPKKGAAGGGGSRLGPVGAGEPLADGLRKKLEPTLGADLGHVRLQRGPDAEAKTAAHSAKAMTEGNNIWLGKGASPDDAKLMAHEATHVVQQQEGRATAPVQRLEASDVIPDAILNAVRGIAERLGGAAPGLKSQADQHVQSAKASVADAGQSAKQTAEGANASATQKGQGAGASAKGEAQATAGQASAAASAATTKASAMAAKGPEAEQAASPASAMGYGAPGKSSGIKSEGASAPAKSPVAPGASGKEAAAPDKSAPAAPAPSGGGRIAKPDDCDLVAMAQRAAPDVDPSVVQSSASGCGAHDPAAITSYADQARSGVASIVSDVRQALDTDASQVATATASEKDRLAQSVQTTRASAGQQIEGARQEVQAATETAIGGARGTMEQAQSQAAAGVDGAVTQAEGESQGLVAQAKSAAGALWSALPGFITSPIDSAGGAISEAASSARAAIEAVAPEIAQAVTQVETEMHALSQQASDALNQAMSEVEQFASEVGQSIAQTVESAVEAVRDQAGKVGMLIDDVGNKGKALWDRAAEATAQEVRGEVCAAVGEAAGPCADRFLPNPATEGGESFASFTTTSEITVPIDGVPFTLAAGATTRVSNNGKEYTATSSGEGSVQGSIDLIPGAPGAPASGDKSSVSVGGNAPRKIAGMIGLGSPPMPTDDATVHEVDNTPTAPPSNDPKKETAKVSAGLKASGVLTFGFSTSASETTCDGLGGLVTFAASQGAGQLMPSPFGSMASAAGQMAFQDKLKSATVTLAKGGSLQVGTPDAHVQAGGTAEAESSVSAGKKKEGDGWVYTVTLTDSGGVGFSATLKSAFTASQSLSSSASIAIAYDANKDNTTVGLNATASMVTKLSAAPGFLDALPASVKAVAEGKLQSILGPDALDYHEGTLTAEIATDVPDLTDLTAAVNGELAKGEGASSAMIWEAAGRWFSAVQASAKRTAKVSLTLAENLGSVKAKVSAGDTSAGTSVGAARGQTFVLFSGPA